MLKHSHRYEYVSASTFVFVNPSRELLGMAIADQCQLLGIEFPGCLTWWVGMRRIESMRPFDKEYHQFSNEWVGTLE